MNRALLVGINKYPSPNELNGCINDVTDMADFLVNQCGFAHDDIRLLTDERATAQAIRDRLNWLITGIGSGDRIIFHYSGHGAQVATRNPQGEADGLDEVICPVDFNFDDGSSMIRDKDFVQLFKTVPAGVEFIWISDSCFSGGLTRGILPSHIKNKTFILPADIAWRNAAAVTRNIVPLGMNGAANKLNVALISGCTESQESADAEIDGRYNGALTYYLLHSLKGQDGLKLPLNQLVVTVNRDLQQAHFTQQPELLGSFAIGKKPFLATWLPVGSGTGFHARHLSDAELIDSRIYHDAWAGEAGERAMGIPIPDSIWPVGLKPMLDTQTIQNINSPLSKADMIVITYTTDETRALSYVFTGDPAFDKNWAPYGHNFAAIRPKITNGLEINGTPTKLGEGIMAFVRPITVNNRRILLVKSEMHPARNGKQLPFIDLIEQLVNEAQPQLVITSGTGGAVGNQLNIGDVVVTNSALFHCKTAYPDYLNDIPTIHSGIPQMPLTDAVLVETAQIDYANNNMMKIIVPGLLGDVAKLHSQGIAFVTANQSPQIYFEQVPGPEPMNVLSADFFSVDDSKDTEKLQELGIMDDMDDAFVALAIKKSGAVNTAKWLSVRNASEPQIQFSSGEKAEASKIYDVCGYHTSINGAFVCWAVICGFAAQL
ncbi:MAG: caspase family protein [Anaerolineaceae bacterium]|nr:caspase family protein [Anaerolineaceae bacterium]